MQVLVTQCLSEVDRDHHVFHFGIHDCFLKGNVADSDSLASFLSGHMQDNELEVCFQIH